MKQYTVKEVAVMSGVSVRTLHHYDRIGLLKPAQVGENGYRYYGREELLRLQQILLHRELEFPLEAIAAVLSAPGFDRAGALRRHRDKLVAEAQRYRRLVKTLDATLASLEGATEMEDKDMYKGFSPEKQAAHESWLVERFGTDVQQRIGQSKETWQQSGPAGRQAMLDELQGIETELAAALAQGVAVDAPAMTALLRRHHAWVARGWQRPPSAEAYAGLAAMYLDHPDFKARFEALRPGLAEYLAEAMTRFAASELA